jgi:hypothetical protein
MQRVSQSKNKTPKQQIPQFIQKPQPKATPQQQKTPKKSYSVQHVQHQIFRRGSHAKPDAH